MGRQEFNPVRIFRIHNEDKIGWMQELIDTQRPRHVPPTQKSNENAVIMEEVQPERESGCNRQVQYINHIFPSSNDEEKKVIFIITNMF